MITIFSCPKPFKGHISIIQRNAIQSWKLLDPTLDIILFGDDEGTAQIAKQFGIRHISNIEKNECGTPLISDIFRQAQVYAKFDTCCYVNADIILLHDFILTVKQVRSKLDSFLIVGQRWDVQIDDLISFDNNWESKLWRYSKKYGSLHPKYGIDYFIFRGQFLNNLLPFAVGRPIWDNWVLFHAASQHIVIINASKSIRAIHQNHDYSHIVDGNGKTYYGKEACQNASLLPNSSNRLRINDANYALIFGFFIPNFFLNLFDDLKYFLIKKTIHFRNLLKKSIES